MKRRSFLQYLAPGAAALPMAGRLAAAAPYLVGAGVSSDPYAATQRAVAASGQWPAMSGAPVMIKPNLVAAKPSSTGITTDPQVVRALVDMALDSGAALVTIVEGGAGYRPANFDACGYGFFSSYDSRVQLLDFGAAPVSLVDVPRGLTYFKMYLPTPAVEPGLVFISAAKLKTHINAGVSLSMKNVFGLASPTQYLVSGQLARQDGHSRGIDQSIVDINLARPAAFSVIDGVWGLEGNGPLSGTPVASNIVFAGRNPVALDRASLAFMQVPQTAIAHLAYAAWRGMGPADTSTIQMLGDAYSSMPFTPAVTGPLLWRPTISPDPISLSGGSPAVIYYEVAEACQVAVDIIYDNDVTPGIQEVRGLQTWTAVPAGVSSVVWDLKSNAGALVPPTIYLARAIAFANQRFSYATGWAQVKA